MKMTCLGISLQKNNLLIFPKIKLHSLGFSMATANKVFQNLYRVFVLKLFQKKPKLFTKGIFFHIF